MPKKKQARERAKSRRRSRTAKEEQQEHQSCFWPSLPEELVVVIAGELQQHEIAKVRTVCRQWAAIFARSLSHLAHVVHPYHEPSEAGQQLAKLCPRLSRASFTVSGRVSQTDLKQLIAKLAALSPTLQQLDFCFLNACHQTPMASSRAPPKAPYLSQLTSLSFSSTVLGPLTNQLKALAPSFKQLRKLTIMPSAKARDVFGLVKTLPEQPGLQPAAVAVLAEILTLEDLEFAMDNIQTSSTTREYNNSMEQLESLKKLRKLVVHHWLPSTNALQVLLALSLHSLQEAAVGDIRTADTSVVAALACKLRRLDVAVSNRDGIRLLQSLDNRPNNQLMGLKIDWCMEEVELSMMAGLKGLRELHIGPNVMEVEHEYWPLMQYTAFSNLEVLVVEQCQNCLLSSSDTRRMSAMVPNLRTVVLEGLLRVNVSDDLGEQIFCLDHVLWRWSNLQHLRLSMANTREAMPLGLSCLPPGLQTLHLGHMHVQMVGANLSSLTELVLEGGTIISENLTEDVTQGIPMLRSLSLLDVPHLHNRQLASWASLQHLTNLEVLALGNSDVNHMALPHLAPLGNRLRRLKWHVGDMVDPLPSLDHLQALQGLHVLSLAPSLYHRLQRWHLDDIAKLLPCCELEAS